MPCNQTDFVGRDVTIEYALACGDVDPTAPEFSWLSIGGGRTKSMSFEWDTADTTADDSVGNLRSNLATFKQLTVSIDGVLRKGSGANQNLVDLTKHVINPGEDYNDQPVAFIRLRYPDLTFIFYALVNTYSREAPYDDVATYTFEAMATSSESGLIVQDTPTPVIPTTITVTPPTASLDVSDANTQQLTVVVGPTGAPQLVNYVSSNPAIATVNSSGLVTPVSAGSATIVVSVRTNSSLVDTCVVTVSA